MGFYLDRLEKKLYKLNDITVIKNAEKDVEYGNIKLIDVRENIDDENIININTVSKDGKYNFRTSVSVNLKTGAILDDMCNCIYSGYYYTNGKQCKHVIASIILYIKEARRAEEEERIQYENMGVNLIDFIKYSKAPKESVKLQIFIDKYAHSNKYEISFKIGQKKMYVLKNIPDFVLARINREDLEFGKGFTYSPANQKFDEQDEKICRYIEEAVSTSLLSSYDRKNFINGKYIYEPDIRLRKFLELAAGKEVILNDDTYTVIKGDMPIQFKLHKSNDMYVLKAAQKDIISITPKDDVYLMDKKIYLPSEKQMKILNPIIYYIEKYGHINFKDENKAELFNNVVMPVEKCGNEIVLDKSIENIISDELKAEFKLDYSRKNMILDVDLKYGSETLKIYTDSSEIEKIIIRDSSKEQEILEELNRLNFEYKDKKFVFKGNEEEFFDFLKEGYKSLEKLGEVYYSDKLKQKKAYINPRITAGINSSDSNYLEFNFQIEDINPAEYKKILEAFHEKRKYYKLKDDSFIDLENEELNDFLGLVESIDPKNKTGKVKIGKNKAVAINSYIEEKKLDYIQGTDIIKDISNKLTDLKKLKFRVPKELKAELRSYQITGFKWFKNLSYLGFGGILADEMGLGKTVQTIAFLLSEKGKKSLIVAPTSLIYNWKNEFAKFAPTMKAAVIHGNKEQRIKVLNNIKEYDVILTTYGTLRNDEESYEDLNFDYCILDEGQNIKNPLSQNTASVKNINAKNKFVLTGTPIENNLIELWSIFDFVMPGYLDSVSNFKHRFVNREDSAIELKKYIKPFMLRRMKKDVIKELPDKIEKNYYVELTKEQKKLYASYVEQVKETMDSKEFEDNKITIFSYLTKLRQLCLDPRVVYDNYKGKNAKSEELVSLLHEYINDNHKILVFSQFTSVLENISKRLNKEKIKHMYLDGSVNASKRLELVKEFNESKDSNVFLISLKAGGTGLNLTSADIVIHFDPWWNPAVEEQATDRAHRIGQKNVVQVIKLISEGTIEDKIINMQEEKKKLINDVLDDGYNSANILKSLSSEELKSLFI